MDTWQLTDNELGASKTSLHVTERDGEADELSHLNISKTLSQSIYRKNSVKSI